MSQQQNKTSSPTRFEEQDGGTTIARAEVDAPANQLLVCPVSQVQVSALLCSRELANKGDLPRTILGRPSSLQWTPGISVLMSGKPWRFNIEPRGIWEKKEVVGRMGPRRARTKFSRNCYRWECREDRCAWDDYRGWVMLLIMAFYSGMEMGMMSSCFWRLLRRVL